MDAIVKEKVYISGAITGVLDYADKFNKAEQELRDMGFDVFNPCNMGIVEGFSWSDYMRKDIAMLMECDYIFPLKGWKKSRGAKIEMKLAKKLGIEVLKLWPKSPRIRTRRGLESLDCTKLDKLLNRSVSGRFLRFWG